MFALKKEVKMAEKSVSTRIKNTSNQILAIRLNSGKTIHLTPKERTGTINKIEIINNPVIEKLKTKNWISTVEKKPARSKPKARPKSKKVKKVKVKK
jgi:hypothetical protein